jgi:ABC-type bacteriocin/lantibiotic exporter with double-glycine peptidase domain
MLIAHPAVERVKEFLEVEQEADAVLAQRPPAAWPSSEGGIIVEDLVIKYGGDLPPVIKGISFEIKPREKVGVVRDFLSTESRRSHSAYSTLGRTNGFGQGT